jgi:hypothetical protein
MQFYFNKNNSPLMKKDVVVEVVVALLVLLFSYTALSKLLEHEKFIFQMSLSHFTLLTQTAGFLSWFLPVAEMIIVVLLLVPKTRLQGLYSSLVLLLSFSFYISAMLLSGWDLPCTCGGIISRLSWKGHLLFNSFFIVLAFIAIVRKRRINSNNSQLDTEINFSRV